MTENGNVSREASNFLMYEIFNIMLIPFHTTSPVDSYLFFQLISGKFTLFLVM